MQLACSDTWKEGSRNSTVGKGGRELASNTLAKKSARYSPYGAKCELCKSVLHQPGKYCHSCAYQKGESPFGLITSVWACVLSAGLGSARHGLCCGLDPAP